MPTLTLPEPEGVGSASAKFLIGHTPEGKPIWAFWKDAERERTRIHIACNDPRIEPTGKAGFHLILEGDKQQSADYNPRYFNAFGKVLVAPSGATPPVVEEHDRHLSRRIASLAPKALQAFGHTYKLDD